MKIKQYEMSVESMEFNRIKEIYESLIANNPTDTLRIKFVKELVSKQKTDGSWSVIKTTDCDLDVCVQYIYFPTYYATAALIASDLTENYIEGSKEKEALMKGLRFATERRLMGCGFDATRQMLDALIIYKNAGVYRWMNERNNGDNVFCQMIHGIIAQMRTDLKNKKTISDWNVDFKEDYEHEISDYDQIESPYVWYACYGSNINKNRFMEYIRNCMDKTPPIEDRPYRFKHSIYFAKTTGRWYNGGKAFLDDTTPGEALGRVYKIKRSQFEEIKNSEGQDYTKLLNLGKIQGIPVYSFTDTQKNTSTNVPSDEYYRTIINGLQDCYSGIIDNSELNEYLINCIFPKHAFRVAKAIKEHKHFLTNTDIATLTRLYDEDLTNAVQWLLSHRVIKQDSRSIRAGHTATDAHAYFYTVDGHCGRKLLSVILEFETARCEDTTLPLTSGNTEGARRFVYASRIERNQQNRIDAIRVHGYKCQACGFDFSETYGELGRNYIEVHHVTPLAHQDGEHIVNPATDLICLCANCHRMVHRNQSQVLSLDKLQDILKENRT